MTGESDRGINIVWQSGQYAPVQLDAQLDDAGSLEQRLRHGEREFSQMVALLPHGLVIHRNNRILWGNPAAARILGVEHPQRLVDMRLLDFVEKDYHPIVTERAHRTQVEGVQVQVQMLEEHLVRVNGEVFEAEVFALPIHFDGELASLVFFSDISLRRKQEREILLAASVYRNSSEGMLVTDERGHILSINPAFERISGYRQHEVLGKQALALRARVSDRVFYRRVWRELLEAGHWSGEIPGQRKDGAPYAERVSINAVYGPDSRVIRYVALFSDISVEKAREETIWRQANYDTLTGLPNRRLLIDHLERELAKCRRGNIPLTLLLIDLDRFKEVNDTLGHAKGDLLLREAGRRIVMTVDGGDGVARPGGDEFVILLPGMGDDDAVRGLAGQLLTTLNQPYLLDVGEEVYVSGSIGIATFPRDGDDGMSLLKHADQAMYAAKAAGRNRYNCFMPSMQREARERMDLGNDLRHALERGEMEVYYQPIIDLASGRIVKAEALLRWHHPSRRMVSPTQFIPLAEESGVIHELGDWVVEQVLRAQQDWRERFGTELQVSINCSPLQFERELEHKCWLARSIGQHVVLEITESMLLRSADPVIEQIRQLRDSGVELAIDDFGTGFSALSYLKDFDIQYLKIDRSFIIGIEHNKKDRLLVEAMIVMAHTLGIRTIVEGVEHPGQHAILQACGCDFGQGFWYAMPLPAQPFTALLQSAQDPL